MTSIGATLSTIAQIGGRIAAEKALAVRQEQIDFMATVMPLDEAVKAQDVKDELIRRFAITTKVTTKRILELAVRVGMVEYQRTPAPYRSYIKRVTEAPTLKPEDNANKAYKQKHNLARAAFRQEGTEPFAFRPVTPEDLATVRASNHFLKRSDDAERFVPVAEAMLTRMPLGGCLALGTLKEAVMQATKLPKRDVDLVFSLYATLGCVAYTNRTRARSHIGRVADFPELVPLLQVLQERGHRVHYKPEPVAPEPVEPEPLEPEAIEAPGTEMVEPEPVAPIPASFVPPIDSAGRMAAPAAAASAPSRDSIILKLLDDLDEHKARIAELDRDLCAVAAESLDLKEQLRLAIEDRDYKALEIEDLKAEIARLKAPAPVAAGLSAVEAKALQDRGYAHLLVPQVSPPPKNVTPETSETSDEPEGELIPFKVPRMLRPAVAEALTRYDADTVHEIVELIVEGVPEYQDQERALKVCLEILDNPDLGEKTATPTLVKGVRYSNLWKARSTVKYRILYMRLGHQVKFMAVGDRANIYGRGHSN